MLNHAWWIYKDLNGYFNYIAARRSWGKSWRVWGSYERTLSSFTTFLEKRRFFSVFDESRYHLLQAEQLARIERDWMMTFWDSSSQIKSRSLITSMVSKRSLESHFSLFSTLLKSRSNTFCNLDPCLSVAGARSLGSNMGFEFDWISVNSLVNLNNVE